MKLSFLFAAALVLPGCALLPDKDKTPQAAAKVGEPQARPQASIEAKQLAAEQEADALAEVQFAPGQATLPTIEAKRLDALGKRLKEGAKIERLIVAAWADKALPGEERKALPTKAHDLAEKRGETVRKLLEARGFKNADLEFYNMAQKPSEFSKFISSADARIKKSLEGARPSKAIVLLLEKN